MRKEPVMNTILHFDSSYQTQQLANLLTAAQFDLTGMDGVRGYCDEASAAAIRNLLADIDPSGMHFLGSGNYHYMSLFFLEKLTVPFSLVVFDHHTDMQPSMFGDLLSCGSWILRALKTLPQLKEVLIIGPGRESLNATKEITFSSEAFSELSESTDFLECCFGQQKKTPVMILKENAKIGAITSALADRLHHPVFLSIDKDVLSADELETDWDQGSMEVKELAAFCRLLSESSHILGIDICGEPDIGQDTAKSLQINRELMQIFVPCEHSLT